MKKSFIVEDLYWGANNLSGEDYKEYKKSLVNTLLYRSYSFVWKAKYFINCFVYTICK